MKFCDIETYYGDDDELIQKRFCDYSDYFNKNILNRLSKDFYKKYKSYHGFHDWDVISIDVKINTKSKPYKYVIITLTNELKAVKIRYNGVRNLQINFNDEHFEQWSCDEYVIDEFIAVDNKYLSHEVCFPSGSNYYLEFKTIRFI